MLEYFTWLQTTVISLNSLDLQFEQSHGFRISYLALHKNTPDEKHVLPEKLSARILENMHNAEKN